MACTSASGLPAIASFQPFQKLTFSQIMGIHCGLGIRTKVEIERRCRRRTVKLVTSASSDGEPKGFSDDTEMRLSRRTLAAFIAVSMQTAFVNCSGATGKGELDSEPKSTSTTISEPVMLAVQGLDEAKNSTVLLWEEKAVAAEVASQQSEAGANGYAFLNSIGVAGSGILGAFYFSKHKAKVASDMAVKDARSKLQAREDAIATLKDQLCGLMSEKEQALKQSKKALEERATLLDELALVKTVADDLRNRLSDEKTAVQSLEGKVERLQTSVKEAEQQCTTLEERLMAELIKGEKLEDEQEVAKSKIKAKAEEIASLHLVLQEKEKVSEDLCSQLSDMSGLMSNAKCRIQELERETSAVSKDLSERDIVVQHLNSKLATAIAQGEEIEKQLATAQLELDQLKESSRKELEEAHQTLSLKEEETQELTQKLNNVSKEAEKNIKVISDLQQEINALHHMLSVENAAIDRLTEDLNSSTLKLETTRAHIAALSEDLATSRELKEELDQKILDIQTETDKNITSLHQALTQEQTYSSQLKTDLEMAQKELESSKMEINNLEQQTRELEVSYSQLKKELVSSQEVIETTNAALTEHRELTTVTEKQLEFSRRAIAEAKENINLLRADVERARLELDNVNKEVSLLTEKLEVANGKVATLEAEKTLLTESLDRERKLCFALKEKVNQVDMDVAKLSRAKQTSIKKAKKLEGTLASSKGQMLRMKKQIVTMDTSLEEAKSRLQSIAENERTENTAEISSKMENIQVDLSQMQKRLEEAETSHADAEVAIESLQNVMAQNKDAENSSLVVPVFMGEGDA
eukprot:c28491_g1_i1 orf=1525-3960(-)